MPSQLQIAAHLCYHWYTGNLDAEHITSEGLDALHSFLGSPLSADELIQFGEKFRQSKDFNALQKKISSQWQHRFEPNPIIDDHESQQFLQIIFDSFDHSLIFDHSIIANITHTARGGASDRENQFSGAMPCWTLHLTTQGKALVLNEEMEVEVTPGDLMLFHPEASYYYGRHPTADHWEHLWVLFQPRAHWSEWLDWNVLDKGILHLSKSSSNQQSVIEQLFRQLINLKDHHGRYQTDLQYNCLEEILIRAKEEQSTTTGKPVDQRIQKACDYITMHLAEPFYVEDVAATCNLSPSRLAHLFKQHMGVSLKSWGNNARLQQARKLLLQTNNSISQIAKQIGYDDPTQFAKSFKKNMGCSPRDFRQSFKS
ncbi:arabinose operon transcriptional regulator AraC [Oceanicoccus sp. KOV_DT_Chl]|uniref:arabinose operon transcriptional regulator AraC n=1 Tax=Oceanicoccus sp. KOV_DT_Chl TaxID=1904639 RepID=UPI00135A9932|nr:arabinose operon transcriptional regulator AraC [Oceanicoccus sp. KOV_DT_Chl]